MEIEVNIDFGTIHKTSQVVRLLSPCFELCAEDVCKLNIHLRPNLQYDLIYPEYLAVVVACYKQMKHVGVDIKLDIEHDPTNARVRYCQRLDFFKHLEYDTSERFTRHSSASRFLEIRQFSKQDNHDVFMEVLNIIRDKLNPSLELFALLVYCFWEVIDNIDIHSESGIGGILCAQHYPNAEILRIVFVDNGIGIAESMLRSEIADYSEHSELELVELALEKGVTSGKGMGNGLYYTKRFVEHNKGSSLAVLSSESLVHIDSQGLSTAKCANWKGTIVYLKIKTDNFVDYKAIMEDPDGDPNDKLVAFIDSLFE